MLLSDVSLLAEGDALVLGGFLVAILVMGLYHLVLYASIRERCFLCYALYLVAFACSCFLWESLEDESDLVAMTSWARAGYSIVDAVAALAALEFVRVFLATRQRLPAWDKVLVGLMATAALVLPLSHPATWTVAIELVSGLSIAGPVALLITGYLSLRQGYRPARYLLIAFSLHLAGIALDTAGEYVSPLPAALLALTDTAYYGGTVLMVILFALALADRYKEHVRQRNQAEAENQALAVISYKDGLTGIWNRRRLDETVQQEWQRAAREQKALSLVLMDVDHFKKYNDNYGHQAGDECLRRVARALQETATRPADLVARYGGEEFAVLVPDTEFDGALRLAESMRKSVVDLALPHEHSTAAPYVTVSVGVASQVPAAGSVPQSLIEAADQALYQAKQSGRNRVCRDSPAAVRPLPPQVLADDPVCDAPGLAPTAPWPSTVAPEPQAIS